MKFFPEKILREWVDNTSHSTYIYIIYGSEKAKSREEEGSEEDDEEEGNEAQEHEEAQVVFKKHPAEAGCFIYAPRRPIVGGTNPGPQED